MTDAESENEYDDVESIIRQRTLLSDTKFEITHPLLVKYQSIDPPLIIPGTGKKGKFTGLFDEQLYALERLSRLPEKDGIVVALTLGGGKFLISILAAIVKKAKNPLLIVPSKLYEQTLNYYRSWALLIPEIASTKLTVISTGDFSAAKSSDYLEKLEPDMIIIDECQDFKNRDAARSNRLKRYLENNRPILVLLTATLFTKSFRDLWLCKYVCKRKFLPSGEALCAVYDEVIKKAPSKSPGTRRDLIECLDEWNTMTEEVEKDEYTTLYDMNYQTRLLMGRINTYPSIIIDGADSCDTNVSSTFYNLPTPPVIKQHIKNLLESWVSPEGEEIVDALEYHRIADMTSLGFFRRFKVLDEEIFAKWKDARTAWSAVLRKYLKGENSFIDSMLLVKNQIKRNGGLDLEILEKWEEMSKLNVRESEYVWIEKEILQNVLSKIPPGTLIWYTSLEVERELVRLGYKIRETSTEVIPESHGVSFHRFHKGANFQHHHCNNLFIQVPISKADQIEQAIGRTHRSGQKKDVTSTFLIASEYHRIKFDKLITQSKAISVFQGTPTKFTR